MWKSSVFKIQVTCPGCNTMHPISSINYFETCYKCGKNMALTDLFEESLFGNLMDKQRYMNAFLAGSIEQLGGSGVGRTGSYKMTYTSGNVYCEECLSPISDESIQNSLDEKKPVECSSCGHKMPLRPATPDMLRFHPKIVAVVNDPQGYDAGEKNTDKNSMLVFSCMTCGAGLNLNADTERNIKCNYCDNDNYLPDSIWIKLHPDKDVQPFFVITDISKEDIDESVKYFLRVTALRVYEKHFINFIDMMFQNLVLSDALKTWIVLSLNEVYKDPVGVNMDISKIQKHFYRQFALGLDRQNAELKELIAENVTTIPVDIQLSLAKDASPSVRLALAKNPGISKDAAKILKSDPDPAISQEAAKHKTGLFGKLFG